MNRKEWLCQEVDAWRQEGLIGDDLAATLHARYVSGGSTVSWGLVIVGAFAALLIGLGIIALFAANWDQLGRSARAFASVLPILLCGGAAIHAAWRGRTTMAFWEPLGILWALATVAGTSLVAQTYNLGGAVPDLILLVTLLTLPVVWVTRSVALTGLWPVFALVWMYAEYEVTWSHGLSGGGAFLLLAASVPAVVALIRRKPSRAALVTGLLLSGFVYAIGGGLAFAMLTDCSFESGILIFWLAAGIVGVLGQAFQLPTWPQVALVAATAVGLATPFGGDRTLVQYLLALVLGILTVGYGVAKLRLRYANLGASLLVWLVLAKFFASTVDFTAKGIVLILAGLALVVMNVTMVKLRKERA